MVLDDEETWPGDVKAFLDAEADRFRRWETQGIDSSYDRIIPSFRDVLSHHSLRGHHCSKLTDPEIETVKRSGMALPNAEMLRGRIRAVAEAGLISSEIANRLCRENQADDSNRAGMLWFCFFPPHRAEQDGIERFLRSWGGEALYNSHEDDAETGPAIARIGTPCLIEADVPVAALPVHSFLERKIGRRYLINRGLNIREPTDHEDRAIRPIPASQISRIIRYPEPDLLTLTGCADWEPPL